MYRNLEAELKRRSITKRQLSEALGVGATAVYKKLLGETEFKLYEAMLIRDTFFPDMTMKYLFTEDGAHKRRKREAKEDARSKLGTVTTTQ